MIPKNRQISGIQILLNENFALQFLNFELNLCRKGQTINYYVNKVLRCQAKLEARIKNYKIPAVNRSN